MIKQEQKENMIGNQEAIKLKKTKVLLISILRDSHRNLSCLSLFSLLNEKNIETKLLFLPKAQEYIKDQVREFILSNNFNIVGISVMTDGFLFAKLLTQDIKEYAPQIHVIWGGIHPTTMPNECLGYSDSVCVGEGEETFPLLIEKIFKGEDFSNLAGIGIKLSDDKIKVNPPPPLIDNLDSLPFIKYDWPNFFVQDSNGLRHFDVNEYVRYSNYKGEDYTIMTSRGCPFSCTYCCNSFLNKFYPKRGIRRRTVNNVIEELKYAINSIGRLKFINFIDDQFLTSKEWTKEFFERYKEEIGLPFLVRLVAGTFDEQDIKMLKNAGLTFAQIGIQSGSERTNKLIFKRRFDRDAIINSSKILSDNGIYVNYDVIIHNELEEDEDRDETIRLLLDLRRPFSLNVFALTLFPNTELESIYKERNITPKRNPYDSQNYFDYDKTDFYFQLVRIIPYAPKDIAKFFFKHSKNKDVRFLLNQYFELTKDRRKEIVIAQDKHYQPPSTLRTGRGDFDD